MSNKSNDEKWEDSAIKTVRELYNEGSLIPSLLLCSAFVEHYCRTRLFISVSNRATEIIKVPDKKTKEMKNASVLCKLQEIIFAINHARISHARIIDIGLLVGAWNYELYNELIKFNVERNHFVHEHEYILKILKKDDEEVKKIIEQGLALLHNIKLGYIGPNVGNLSS
jgi:predicted ATPase